MTKKELNKIVTAQLHKFGVAKATVDREFSYNYENDLRTDDIGHPVAGIEQLW